MISRMKNQKGISIIGCIFILMVLSAIGVYLQSINTMQQTGSTQTLQKKRTDYALKSGEEWVKWKILTGGGVLFPANLCPSLGATLSIDGIDVGITACVRTDFIAGLNLLPIFTVTLDARTQSNTLGDLNFSSVTRTLDIRGNLLPL